MNWRENTVLAGVAEEVRRLHVQSENPSMREWFYDGHVLVVADVAAKIAAREGARVDIPVMASLMHDVARTIGVEDEPALTQESERLAREIMARQGVGEEDVDHVCRIMAGHSCRGGVVPETLEGKAMVTADAWAHIMTDFFFVLPFNGWLYGDPSVEKWKKWAAEKVQRDYHNKVQFNEEREEMRARVGAFVELFGRG